MRSSKSLLRSSRGKVFSRRLLSSFLVPILSIAITQLAPTSSNAASQPKATAILSKLLTKGRAPKTGYDRALFSDGWGDIGDCDTRNFILSRDLTNLVWRNSPKCTVASGTLKDPYTGTVINFVRGVKTSTAVQIDHVVPVSDAWQKGAQQLSSAKRYSFYNDPLNLLAVDGPTNEQKSDSDAASWLPPNRAFWCPYVARQIAVKFKYQLWVTSSERSAMLRVLKTCPKQAIPKG
jgi:hypothetical protein